MIPHTTMAQTDADSERPMTLIEKLNDHKETIAVLRGTEKQGSNEFNFLGHHLLGFQTAINIVKQHQAESGWISADERLPEDDENVLVYSGDKEMFIAWCGVLGRTWRDSFRDAPYDELVGISITHWMPLPKPPSEAQE